MLDQLKSLAVFARTVELGSFRGAARELGLSPSVVSHHVSELERALSLPLLYRSTRHLALTAGGEKLYQAARAMLAAAADGLQSVSAPEAPARLRMTAPAMLAETRFCRDLEAFARAHPNLSFSVRFTEERRDLLREQLDLALRIGRLDDSSLMARKLAEMPRLLCVSPHYLAGRRAPRSLADLAGWDFIHLSAIQPRLELLPPRKKTPRTLTYVPRISVDSATAMRELAVAGLGVARLPELMARAELARGRLIALLPAWRVPSMAVHAVWPAGRERAPLTMRFVDFIQPRLTELFAQPMLSISAR
jgi:DNA-binding transcriptional LysR family regulator